MQASEYNIVPRIFGSSTMILRIPVYQRNYDWNENNVKQLLRDIKTIIKTKKQHFMGSIVYLASQDNDVGMQDYLIIDGQQRLTTITLLFQALKELCAEKDQADKQQIDGYLTNMYTSDSKYKIKLKPIQSDNIQYLALLKHKTESLDKTGNIYKNYFLAKTEFQKWLNQGITIHNILMAMNQLEVVGISLTQGIDNPQEIFASLNSTGMALTNTDLIRNFLLMTDKDQQRLFIDYWRPIERKLRRDNTNRTMDAFFRQFMIMKRNATVTERKVYSEYVNVFHQENQTHESALQELTKYANLYNDFLHPQESDYNDQIKADLSDLQRIDLTTCYPFLLRVFNDYKTAVIDEGTLTKVVRLITIYLIRRTICNVPSNSLLGFFASYYSRTFRVKKNKERYYDAINKYLFSQTNRNEVPDDGLLENSLIHSKIYLNKHLCNLVILDIENGGSKEKLNTKDLTIEHILPQTMSKSWRENFTNEQHKEYVHTLGNLSVTGYNSEMSNKSFSEKKKIIKQYSRARILNEDVVNQDEWTVSGILSRAKRLSKILLKRYELIPVNDPQIEFEAVDKIYVKDESAATGRKPVSFTLEGSNYPVKTFKEITLKVTQILDQDDPSRLETLIGLNWKGNFDKSNMNNRLIFCRRDDIQPKLKWHYAEVRDGIFVMVGGSAYNIMHVLKLVLEAYQIPEDQFNISVRTKSDN